MVKYVWTLIYIDYTDYSHTVPWLKYFRGNNIKQLYNHILFSGKFDNTIDDFCNHRENEIGLIYDLIKFFKVNTYKKITKEMIKYNLDNFSSDNPRYILWDRRNGSNVSIYSEKTPEIKDIGKESYKIINKGFKDCNIITNC